jgi:hypothetical protein
MRAKIRWPRIGLVLLTLLFLSAIPLTAEAVQVKFCVPFCAGTGADPTPNASDRGPGIRATDVNGVVTTTLTITSFVYKGFTISGTVVALQSGTLQKITFNPTAITANATAGCNNQATNPCRLEIIATSHVGDFPTAKPIGGYPAGVFMAGFFTGVEPATGTNYPSPGPQSTGDSISMTSQASGLKVAASGSPTIINDADALSSDVVNATGGAGAGDTQRSLPKSCAGSPTCKFAATTLTKSFNSAQSTIQETVQQVCESGVASCLTRLRARVNLEFKTAGNRVNLPAGTVSVDSAAAVLAGTNAAALLIAETLPPFENLDVRHLLVFRNNFALDARFTLSPEQSINPAAEEVYLRVGSFAMTIPAGKFQRLLSGKLFTFVGKVDGKDVAATFSRVSTSPQVWTFAAGVLGVNLTGLPQPPAQVSVDLAVGNDTGSDLVTASIF